MFDLSTGNLTQKLIGRTKDSHPNSWGKAPLAKPLIVLLSICLLAAESKILLAKDAKVDHQQLRNQLIGKAISFLRTKGQAADGSYDGVTGPGVTALVTTALLRSGRSPSDPQVAKSLKYLEGFVRKDGGIYKEKTLYRNYETCLAVLCFSEANRRGRYDTILENADKFLKGLQWDEGEGIDKSNIRYGGAGYGRHERPDLSNEQMLVDALKATGNDANSEAIQRALIFISRCQNLESEHNQTKSSAKVNDGGFHYTPLESQAGTTENGGLRSYASMTYAGLKSMIYAGLDKNDKRVQAAIGWIQKNYDLKTNPGMGSAGLFYYYHTFAKTLDAMGMDRVEDAEGKKHDWRKELIEILAQKQRPDGSWINTKNERWLEGNPNLVTGYALLALSYCKADSKKVNSAEK